MCPCGFQKNLKAQNSQKSIKIEPMPERES